MLDDKLMASISASIWDYDLTLVASALETNRRIAAQFKNFMFLLFYKI